MKKIWLLPCTIFLVLCFSCSKEGEMDLGNKPKKIAIFYLNSYIERELISALSEMKLTYKGNKLTRITGDVMPLPLATGYKPYFTDEIYWDVNLSGNRAILKKKSTNAMMAFTETHELLYRNKLIVERTIVQKDVSTNFYSYEYEGNRLKKEYRYVDGKLYTDKTFYFNQKQNLDSIVSEFSYVTSKTVEIFSNYDTQENKVRGLTVLEDLMPRALSKNNYLKKTTVTIFENGQRTPPSEKKWDVSLFN